MSAIETWHQARKAHQKMVEMAPDRCDICRPHVMAQLPQLAAMVDEIEQRCRAGDWQALRLDLIERLGQTLPLSPIDEAAP